MKARMVLAAPPIRKTHVSGRSRRPARFSLRKHPVSTSLHRGLSPVGYDFALANGDELVSYTVAKPRKAPVRYYTHSNHLYSVAATTNTAGAVVERYSYSAFGGVTIKNSVGATLSKSRIQNDNFYSGRRLDSETSNYQYRSRYYSAKFGRFLNRMPWFYSGAGFTTNYEILAMNEEDIAGMEQVISDGWGSYFQDRWSVYDFQGGDPANSTEPYSGKVCYWVITGGVLLLKKCVGKPPLKPKPNSPNDPKPPGNDTGGSGPGTPPKKPDPEQFVSRTCIYNCPCPGGSIQAEALVAGPRKKRCPMTIPYSCSTMQCDKDGNITTGTKVVNCIFINEK